MANGWNPLIGLGFTALGVGYLWEAYQRSGNSTPLGYPALGVTADGLRPNLPQAQLQGRRLSGLGYAGSEVQIDSKGRKVLHVRDGVRTIQFHEAGDIDRRLKFIIDQMKKDSRDPKTITEATSILSGKCPVAKGGLKWCVPAKNWVGEVSQLFYALVNPNSPYSLRYGRDPAGYDAFRSSELMRRIPSGDCDDMTIRLGAWLLVTGYSVKCRIVAPRGQPGQWAHIYLVAGVPPGENAKWIPLDPTEPHPPGWEVSGSLISGRKDFEVSP